jgi:hypothetical protein
MGKVNSEFNYRYQVIGETVWEKIKTLLGFLDSRKRALALEEVVKLKNKAMYEKLNYLKSTNAPLHEILELEGDIVEMESSQDEQNKNFDDARAEYAIIEKLLKEYYEIAEPTRLKHDDGTPYSDEEMFEVNAANEFTVWMVREMQSEIMANGHISAARIKNAMSNPVTWQTIKQLGLIDAKVKYFVGSVDPTKIKLLPVDTVKVAATEEDILALTQTKDASKKLASQRKETTFE